MWRLTALMAILVTGAVAKTNIVQLLDNNSLENSLPESTFEGGRASVNCDKGYLEIELNFKEPFSGVVNTLNSSCQAEGDGSQTVRLNLFYNETCVVRKGFGEFFNDILIRYKQNSETSKTTSFTAKCSYGPPIIIPAAPLIIKQPTTLSPPAKQQATPKNEQITTKAMPTLLILCGILFLSLVLLGLISSYYVLKRRRVQVVRHLPPYMGHGPEVSKLTDTNSYMSTYEELSIPRSKFIPPSGRNPDSDVESYPSGYISESPRSGHTSTFDNPRISRSDSSNSRENKVMVHNEPRFDNWMQFTKPPVIEYPLSSNTNGINTKEENFINCLGQDIFNEPSPNLRDTATSIKENCLNRNKDMRESLSINIVDSEVSDQRRSQRDFADRSKKSLHYVPRTLTEQEDLPVMVSRQPEVTKSIIEDVFLKTIIEKRTIEEIEKRKRQEIQPNMKPQTLQPNWGVTIRNYPNPNPPSKGNEEASDWDSFSETSSLSSYSHPEHHITHKNELDIQQNYRSSLEIPLRDPFVKNWDILIKVLELPQRATNSGGHNNYQDEQYLTEEDRKLWRDIITTESTLRDLLSEATTREDFERIRLNHRYNKLFEPKKWELIIRVLAPTERFTSEEERTRNRMGSLSTVYEYDSDGAGSVQTLTGVHDLSGEDVVLRSRKTSRSSLRSNVRSVGELTVNHALQTAPENANDNCMYF